MLGREAHVLIVYAVPPRKHSSIITSDSVYTGLSRAFLAAGAACVIVTLWKIDDRSACELMTSFYREYMASRDAAVSLQLAMKTLQAKENTRSPQHWAAFSIVGVTGI